MTKTKPSLIDAASWMALPIGIMWAASFFCTMYGYDRPALSMLSSALGVFSIFVLYKQLANYRKLFPSTSWLHVFRLSFVVCLLAGLLTDAAQYLYFLFLDNGRLLSLISTTMQSEEYREAWKQIMPEANLEEMQKMIQQMTVRDIMMQLATYNIMLALPLSLLAALPVKAPRTEKEEEKNEKQ